MAARIQSRAEGELHNTAIAGWRLVDCVPALRPPAGAARDLPPGARRVRRLLAALLGLRRGLLRRTRRRPVPGRRAAGVWRARACVPLVPARALLRPRSSLQRGWT